MAFLTLGIVSGFLISRRYLKKKYEEISQEEIDSVKKVFSARKSETSEKPTKQTKVDSTKNKPDIMEYISTIQNQGYTDYSNSKNDGEKENTMNTKKPYVILPEEFGCQDEYDVISLLYFADHVLSDDSNQLIDDIDNIIGLDSLNHFGEYEDDSVFVRNDELKCDYEILLDQRLYSDVIEQNPYQFEG